jgi:putative copper export protein
MGVGSGAAAWVGCVLFLVSGLGAGASHIEHVEEVVEFENVQFTHCQFSPAGGLSVSVCTVAGAVVEAVGSGTVMAAAVAMARTRNTVVPSMTPHVDNNS